VLINWSTPPAKADASLNRLTYRTEATLFPPQKVAWTFSISVHNITSTSRPGC